MFLKVQCVWSSSYKLIKCSELISNLAGKKKKGKRAFYSREACKHPASAAVPRISKARVKERDNPREPVEEVGCLSSPSSPPLGIQVTTWPTY